MAGRLKLLACSHVSASKMVWGGLALLMALGPASAEDLGCFSFRGLNVEVNSRPFGSEQEAVLAIDRITDAVGLPANFRILPNEVVRGSIAIACIHKSTRYILYSPTHIKDMVQTSKTEWSQWGAVAHEVGHHLAGHTLVSMSGISDERIRADELEADQFAGFVLSRLGASLNEAWSAFQMLPEKGTRTHPPRAERLEAVMRGWGKSQLVGPEVMTFAREVAAALAQGKMPLSRIDPFSREPLEDYLNTVAAKLKEYGELKSVWVKSRTLRTNGSQTRVYIVNFEKQSIEFTLEENERGLIVSAPYKEITLPTRR